MIFLNHLDVITQTFESAAKSCFGNTERGILQKGKRLFHPEGVYIFREGTAELFFEIPAEIFGGQMQICGDVLQEDFFLIVIPDIGQISLI